MSRAHCDYLVENMAELRAVVVEQPNGRGKTKQRTVLNGEGYALWHWVCDQADERTGIYRVGLDTTVQRTGITKTNVSRDLKMFCELGWLEFLGKTQHGKYKPVNTYRVLLGLSVGHVTNRESESQGKSQSESRSESRSKSRSKSRDIAENAKTSIATGENATAAVLTLTPTQTQTPTRSTASDTRGTKPEHVEPHGGNERALAILERCIAHELQTTSNAGPGLEHHLRAKYLPIVESVLGAHPEQRDTWLIDACIATKRGTPLPAPHRQTCHKCTNTGYVSPEWGRHEPCPECRPGPAPADVASAVHTVARRFTRL